MLRRLFVQTASPLAALTLVLALTHAAPAVAQAPPVIVFDEIATSLDPLFTQPRESFQGDWSVVKLIRNGTTFAWTDYHITLQVWNGTAWVESGEGDGISFGQPTPFEQWLNSVRVDINGVFVAGWHVVRTNVPFDNLDFFFDTFVIPPGAQLSLHFDMSDTVGGNLWRLKQIPTIPEPGTWALWTAGLAGLGWCVRRRRGAGTAV